MDTNELLLNFINRGGVITLYPSLERDRYPIRFAAKWQGIEYSGSTPSLDVVLYDFISGEMRDDGPMPIDGEDARLAAGR